MGKTEKRRGKREEKRKRERRVTERNGSWVGGIRSAAFKVSFLLSVPFCLTRVVEVRSDGDATGSPRRGKQEKGDGECGEGERCVEKATAAATARATKLINGN
jgi:hypothetical protein